MRTNHTTIRHIAGYGSAASERCRDAARLAACLLLVAALGLPATAQAQDQDQPQTQPQDLPDPQHPAQPQTSPGGAQPGQGAQARIISQGLTSENFLRVDAGKTAVLDAAKPVTEISVGDPSIAEINLLSPTRVLVTGLKAGTTQLLIFAGEESQIIEIRVEVDITGLRTQLEDIFPNIRLLVRESKGRIILQGVAPDLQAAEQIVQVAGPYGEVLNFLDIAGGQQIMLQVIFAEVSRSATSRLGVNFGGIEGTELFGSNVGGAAAFGLGENELGGLTLTAPTPGAAVTLFGGGEIGSTAFAAFIAALRDNNLIRVLARPNLVAISGETASFLAGGEFPIPVAQTRGGGATGAITVEFREFGVKLEFVPIVMGDGRIRLQASPEVSDVDFSNAVQLGGFLIPGLTQRKVTTTVELADGQSLAIAGLLDNRITSNKSMVPLLGDLPVLGTLFRSVRYQRRETELIVFVTPRLVAGLNPGEIPAVPGQRWDHPTEAELFFLGNIGRPAAEGNVPGDGAPLFFGPYGFNRAETEQPAPSQQK